MIVDPSYLPALTSRVLDLGLACLEDTPNGAPADSGLYHTQPPADCCDGLYVWVERIFPTRAFPADWTGPVDSGGVVPAARIAVRLYRPCWPVVKDNPHSPFPPASESDIAAANLQMDAIKLFCCILGDLSAEEDESIILNGECLKTAMGGIDPGPPSGGCASWTLRFVIELPPCCI